MNDRPMMADVNRAEHAQRLLNDELLRSALDAIKTEVVRTWIDCEQSKKEDKEALWQLMKTADKFEFLLLGYIEKGKLGRANLKQFEERTGLRRVFG